MYYVYQSYRVKSLLECSSYDDMQGNFLIMCKKEVWQHVKFEEREE